MRRKNSPGKLLVGLALLLALAGYSCKQESPQQEKKSETATNMQTAINQASSSLSDFAVIGGKVAENFEKGGIGFVITAGKDKSVTVLKKTKTPFRNTMRIRGQLKSALGSGVRNGMIVFGENPKQLSSAVLFMGGQVIAIQGKLVNEVKKSNKIDPTRIFDTELTINLKEGAITWKVDGNETKTTFKTKPASISHVGYSAWNTKTEFSELEISGD